MVDGIGSGSGALGREAIRAAIDAQARAAERLRSSSADSAREGLESSGAAGQTTGASFGDQLTEGIKSVNSEINRAESLPEDFVSGKIEDFHEIAVQMKRADIGFRFALEIRNKLIDAYREVMRMSV